MNKKTAASLSRIILTSLVMLLSIAAMSSATNIIWDNGNGDYNWNEPLNWIGHAVPGTGTDQYARIRTTAGPVFSGQTANVYRIYLETAGNGTLTMNSGTLNTVNHIYAAALGTDRATINMNGGDVNVGGTFYVARDANSVADVNLSGGTITCAELSISIGGKINITGTGTLIINGDAIATITPWINSGWIKAYNGVGTVIVDTTTTPGKTIVTGLLSYKALIPNPVSDTNKVAVNGTNLIWRPGFGAASHDVYLGTDSNDVNSANRLLGDLNEDDTVDLNDISLLTEYWLQDPTGTDPNAGVNDDNIVDFIDYALLAQDWMESESPVFKGNQDANSFSPGTLAFDTKYYWRIDEVNGPDTVKGDVWNFATQTGKASIVTPLNGEPNVLSRAVLVWTADVGAISHDVYLGTTNPPATLVSDNQTATIYNPGGAIVNSITYYWRIDENYGATTIQGDVWNFTTINEANEPDLVFVQASDPQMGWSSCGGTMGYLWGTTIGKINNINPDFMLVTGDLVDNSTSDPQVATYKSYKSALNPTIECFEVPGNHDLGEPPDQAKYDRWANNYGYGTAPGAVPWYSFAYGNSFFIGLDTVVLCSPFNGQDVNEMNWLTQTLTDANTAGYDHIFVFMHYGFTGDKWGGAPARAAELKALLQEYHVKAVFDGHTHYDAYAMYGTLEDFTTRSCTCNLGSSPPPPGVRIVKVYSDRIEQEVRTLDSLP